MNTTQHTPANLRAPSHLLRCLPLLAIWFSVTVQALAQSTSTVQFAASAYTVAESAGAVTLTVQRVNDTNTPVSVDYTTADGTAINRLKYTAVAGTLAFGAGETNQTIVVPILNEGFVEGTKTFRVILSNAINAVLGTRTNATVSITDSDVGIQFQLATSSVAEDAGAVLIGIVRGDDATLPVTADLATTDLTATNGLDYTGITNTVSFAPTERLKFVPVPILNDSLKETLNKTFRVTLSNPVGATLGSMRTTTVTIVDNDQGFQFELAGYTLAEDAGVALVNVLRGSDDTSLAASVDQATSDITATSGLDYTGIANTLAFAPGEKVKLLRIPILNDGIKEPTETFRVTLSHPTGGAVLGSRTTTTVSILDNDPGLGFELSSHSVSEKAGVIVLTVLRGNDRILGPITVDFATADVTATGGHDYQAVSGTLEFQANETVKRLTIPILPDGTVENPETFRVTLSKATGGAVLGTATTTVAIQDASEGTYAKLAPPFDTALAIRRDRDVNILTWTGGGTLQKADRPTGPWQTLTTAKSPCSVQSQIPTTFYRVTRPRPVNLYVPSTHDGQTAMPLVILLHGYGESGQQKEDYMKLGPLSEARGFLYCYPDGGFYLRRGVLAWNSTDALSDYENTPVDDAAYLRSVIEETGRRFAVDRKRVYLIGQSNGGFMVYRMACESADLIAGIASLAGATYLDPNRCAPSEPVNILHIHGTADATITYGGGATSRSDPPQNWPPYPGVVQTAQTWAGYNGASGPVSDAAPSLDLTTDVAGLDTVVTRYTTCPPGGTVELWTINGGSHVPTLSAEFSPLVIDWLLAHPKP
jgi:polyhydroxybutyrate depolymerase